jgi:hypothetical protein
MTEVITVEEKQLVVVDGDSPSVIETTEQKTIVEVGGTGPQGPPGPEGPTGPSGSGDKSFKQDFTIQSSVTVTHNLGKYPAVTVINSAGDEVIGDVNYINEDSLTVSFSSPFSGSVLCN